MACYAGRNGVITLDGTAVAQITSYTVNETADTAECTHFDTGGFREYKTTFKSFDGSFDLVWDRQDGTIDVGAEYDMILYPEGDNGATLDWTISGTIIITGLEISAETEGNVEASVTFQGTGDLVRAAEV